VEEWGDKDPPAVGDKDPPDGGDEVPQSGKRRSE